MSLGWQGESALLPRRAKNINVDNTSMQGLRAAVYDEQERRQQRLEVSSTSVRKNRGLSATNRKEHGKGSDLFSRENRGVREREKRDMDKAASVSRKDKVKSALEAKSRIYDKLVHQAELRHEGGNSSSGSSSCQEVLVDFVRKGEEKIDDCDEDGYCNIVDEFGRERRVLPNSEEYIKFQQMKKISASFDQKEDSWEQQRAHSREFLAEVRGEVAKACEEIDTVGGGIRSQWDEKVLRGDEREHLNSVHRQTEYKREQHQKQLKNESGHKRHHDDNKEQNISTELPLDSRNSINGNKSTTTSAVTVKSTGAVASRRELLLRKQMDFKKRKLEKSSGDNA